MHFPSHIAVASGLKLYSLLSLLSLSPPNSSQDGAEAVILESRTGSEGSCHVNSEASVSRDKSLGPGKDI